MGKKYSKNTNNIKYVIKHFENPNLQEYENIIKNYIKNKIKYSSGKNK